MRGRGHYCSTGSGKDQPGDLAAGRQDSRWGSLCLNHCVPTRPSRGPSQSDLRPVHPTHTSLSGGSGAAPKTVSLSVPSVGRRVSCGGRSSLLPLSLASWASPCRLSSPFMRWYPPFPSQWALMAEQLRRKNPHWFHSFQVPARFCVCTKSQNGGCVETAAP